MLQRLILVLSLLVCTGCATVTDLERRPLLYGAAAADTVTTQWVINQGGRELNPLGFFGVTAAKLVYLNLDPLDQPVPESLVTALWFGLAVNNAIQALAAPPLFISIVPGIIIGRAVYDSIK